MNKSAAMFESWLSNTKPVIPVIVVDRADDTARLANAFYEGGIKLLEVTLRTPSAIGAIDKMSKCSPDIIVGAGTVISVEQVDQVKQAGGRFIVSPGFSNSIAERTEEWGMAYLPGVATATEIMMAIERRYSFLKFFPAAQAGGIDMLKALSGPFFDITFCPTGGISKADFKNYLALDNVRCVGGSWIASRQAIKEKAWGEITDEANQI